MPNLKGLYVDITNKELLEQIGAASGLRRLSLFSRINAIPDSFKDLHHLKELNIFIDGEKIPDFVHTLPALEFLDILNGTIRPIRIDDEPIEIDYEFDYDEEDGFYEN